MNRMDDAPGPAGGLVGSGSILNAQHNRVTKKTQNANGLESGTAGGPRGFTGAGGAGTEEEGSAALGGISCLRLPYRSANQSNARDCFQLCWFSSTTCCRHC